MLLKVDILVAYFFINLLALAVPLYVIQALTRFLSNGVYETLYALTFGVFIAILLEFLFKQYRKQSILQQHNLSNPTKSFFNKLKNINFNETKIQSFRDLPQKLKEFREKESRINLNIIHFVTV